LNIQKSILILFILCLPYNNFPFINDGALKPLSIVPLFVYIFYRILFYVKTKEIRIGLFDKWLIFIFIYYLFSSLIVTWLNYSELLELKKVSPIYRWNQFLLYVFISLGSYFIGKKIIKYYSVTNVFKILVIAFLPSIMFGLIEILTHNNNIVLKFRELFTTTIYPPGYYRVLLLTTEPSWAAFDLVVFLIPITAYLFIKERKLRYIILLAIELLLLIMTKSLLGFILLGFFLVFVFLFNFNVRTFKKSILFFLAIIVVFPLLLNWINKYDEISIIESRLNSFIQNEDYSGLTRTASYEVALNIFKEYPIFGVGFRNAGYFYGKYINPEYLYMPLISDWANPFSTRFPDNKSTLLEILASSGIMGTVPLLFILVLISKQMRNLKKLDPLVGQYFIIIMLLACIGSFSIMLIGYPLFWFILGLIMNINKYGVELRNEKKDFVYSNQVSLSN
jgi:O-antigen ligase